MTFDSASSGCTEAGTKVTCRVAGSLAVNGRASFDVDTTASDTGTQNATVSTTGSVFDPITDNNDAALTTTVS